MAKDLHVVMIPWSAFGHIIPFFHLSIALAKFGVNVSFVSTPTIINRLPPIPQFLLPFINLNQFPLPAPDGDPLPEGAEATVDVPSDKVYLLKIAYDLLQQPLKQFLATEQPDWVIIDLIPHWIVDIAKERKIRVMHFYVGSASASVFINYPPCLVGDSRRKLRPSWESLTLLPEWIHFPSTVAYKKHEAVRVYEWMYGEKACGITDAERIATVMDGCEAIAVRSCLEIESDYINTLQKIMRKPVIPAGLLPPEKPKSREIKDDSFSPVFKWLDQQKPNSVVFVSFGSEFKLTKDQVFEIAYGLELSGLPFLWSLRKPSWAKDEVDASPSGFGDRTNGKGIVSIGWAPQMEILEHPSIGGSLFHSGWGSIIETLQFGHCLVVLPLIIDQPLNARLLVEKGLAVEIERNEEDGCFSRDGIGKGLRLAMVSEEGKELRERISKAAEIFGNQKLHQDYYIHNLVEFLKNKE